MIGRLQGVLLEKGDGGIMLDVHGVGYEVEVPLSTLSQLSETGAAVILHTHLVIREDAHHLFGFFARKDRELFRLLIKVNGIGPKLALGILSAMDSAEVVARVMQEDVKTLVRLPGIGRKTAERLIIELRDRLKEWQLSFDEGPRTAAALGAGKTDHLQEAEAALVSLGYRPQEAARAIIQVAAQLEAPEAAGTEQLIRAALQHLGRSAGA